MCVLIGPVQKGGDIIRPVAVLAENYSKYEPKLESRVK
jgi:hypothetical protein